MPMTPAEPPHDLIVRDKGRGFLLRIRDDAGNVTGMPDLGPTLPGAVRAAVEMGRHPTHWANESGTVSLLPDAIMPQPAESRPGDQDTGAGFLRSP